jgi:hypothetical protein
MWLCIMKANPVVPASGAPPQVIQLAGRTAWPEYVSYPQGDK